LQTKLTLVVYFHDCPKEVKGQHIKNKMHVVRMDQSAGYKPVILLFFTDCRGPENKVVHYLPIFKTGQCGNTGNDDDDKCDIEHEISKGLKDILKSQNLKRLVMMILLITTNTACTINLFRQDKPDKLMRESKGGERPDKF
jgi:hypothetical protein